MKTAQPTIVSSPSVGSDEIMTAAIYSQHGDESVIEINERMMRPTAGEDELLVKVLCCGINPVDVKLRENSLPEWFIPLPKIIGSDLCGVVVQVGKNVGDDYRVGDRVFAMMPHIWSGWGSAAEYATVHKSIAAKAPSNICDIEAGSLPLVGLTVLQGFQQFVSSHPNDTAGRRVLVQAAAGGLGSFAVQYCKNELGMQVYATCSEQNMEFVRSLGADEVINYATTRFEDVCEGMDVVFDPMAYLYEDRTFRSNVLKKGSYYIHVASSPHSLLPENRDIFGLTIPEAAPAKILRGHVTAIVRHCLCWLGMPVPRYVYQFVHPDGARLAQVAALVENGRVKTVVETENIFPLQEMVAAQVKQREGHVRGKIVVEIAKQE